MQHFSKLCVSFRTGCCSRNRCSVHRKHGEYRTFQWLKSRYIQLTDRNDRKVIDHIHFTFCRSICCHNKRIFCVVQGISGRGADLLYIIVTRLNLKLNSSVISCNSRCNKSSVIQINSIFRTGYQSTIRIPFRKNNGSCLRLFLLGGFLMCIGSMTGSCWNSLILHHNTCYAAITIYRECDAFRNTISVRRSNLGQGVGLAGNQFANDLMRLIGGCPLFYHISILILNGKLCSRQFRTGGQIYLGNGDMRRLVFHHYGINGAILADCKGDVFCVSVSSRCSNLSHGVRFASNKFANNLVWLIGGCPLINHISILILDRDVCSRKLVSGCNVGLADVYMCRLIFHHNLINGTVSAYCKLNIYRVCKAVRCSDLSHGIGLAGNELANDLM